MLPVLSARRSCRGRRTRSSVACAALLLGSAALLTGSSSFVSSIVRGGRPPSSRVLSNRIVREARGGSAALDVFADLDAGEWQNGVVESIAPFGAFVTVTLEDGSAAKGLVHISQLRDGFVDSVYDEVEEGQEVRVRVLSVDLGRNQMSLSMKEGGAAAPRRGPVDLSPFEGIASDQWLTGKVARTASFGAFVTVTAPDSDAEADGLVHLTQIKDGYVESVEDEVEVGQEVQVRVLSVDVGASKMSLSMKEEGGGSSEPADLSPFEGLASDQWLTGKVARIARFGAFVTVTAPDSDAEADGLVHVTQIKDGYVESIEDELEVGQEVQVRVVSVDVEEGKMGLSMREEGADDEEGEEEDME